MQKYIIHLPRLTKQAIVAALDAAMSALATWMAFYLRLDDLSLPTDYQWLVYALSPALTLPIFIRFGLYRAVFRYNGISALVTISKAVAVYCVLLFGLLLWLQLPGVPRTVGLIQPMLVLIMLISSRTFARFWLAKLTREHRSRGDARFLIYGAGAAGAQIADALLQTPGLNLYGFIDDATELHGKTLNGIKVHRPQELDSLIRLHGITDILLALPTITRARRNQILDMIRPFHVHVRSLPNLTDLAQGKVDMSDMRELDISDLLGRDPVAPDEQLMKRHIAGKTVLVTGAGGSIGSELCRQILLAGPARLLLLDHNEFSLYTIHQDLEARCEELGTGIELMPLLGSVCNPDRLAEIFRMWSPHTVYHAAAYKHVPLVEHNPGEGIRNNVFGTFNVVRAAVTFDVREFILVSTDKAVRPTNVMGASKRLAEMLLQAISAGETVRFSSQDRTVVQKRATRFSMVRFGNVLNSSGSVVPLFRRQIKQGGPITLTDAEVTRYFMTITEAAQLVIQAGAMASGGDVFVLDMGQPVKIIDLARRMIELSGLEEKTSENPFGDIEIKITGLRPGEKLYEELLLGENPKPTLHSRIVKAHEDFLPWPQMLQHLEALQIAVDNNDIHAIREILQETVIGYMASDQVVDWIYLAEQSEKMLAAASH